MRKLRPASAILRPVPWGTTLRFRSFRLAAAILAIPSAAPTAATAQSAPAGGFQGAVGTQLRDAAVQSPTPSDVGAPAVISGPVGGAPDASAGTPTTGRVWMKGFGFQTHVGADANGPAWTAKGVGGAVGAERLLLPNFLVGAAFGYTDTNTGNPIQDVHAQTISGALYGSYAIGGLEFNGLGGINGNRYDSKRIINVLGTPTSFQGPARALGWSIYGDAGYRFQMPTALGPGYVKPLVALNYSSLDRERSTELSSGGLALVYSPQTFEHLTSLVGVDLGFTHALAGGFVRPEFRLGWIHEYTDPAPAVFASLGGLPFVTRDPQPGRDGLSVGIQTTMWSRQNVQVFLGYNGEFRANLETHQGTAGFRYSW